MPQVVSASVDAAPHEAIDAEWHEVDSSNVHSLRYEESSKDLYVKFQSGQTYKYAKVDLVVFTGLKHADSVGRFLNQNIKPFHSYELVQL